MKLEILVFDEFKDDALNLVNKIEYLMEGEQNCISYKIYSPREVFNKIIAYSGQVIFFTVTNMYSLEAARRVATFHKESFLAVVSDTEEYGTWAWSLGADYYLLRPIIEEELLKTLKKSEAIKTMKFVEV